MKHTISVVISAYNEEKTLARCLRSVSFADEIIVVDNTSSDGTRAIAQTFTKSVYGKPNKLMLNENKNFGFTKATGEWILNLDADEEVSPVLASEIKKTVESAPSEDGFWLKRKNYSFGKWIRHGLWWPDKQLRLFRRGKGAFPCVHIHEYIKVDGRVGELAEPYIHHNYESIHQYLTKIDRASSSEAISLRESKYILAWYDALRFPVSDFLKIFFAQSAWKDGLHGLVLSLLQAFYSFCVFAKLWEADHFPERDISVGAIRAEMQRTGRESLYWILTTEINEEDRLLPKLTGKIKRKLLKTPS
jgi:glycosyltransferase involved in cell wall biosynthesis